MVYRRLSTLKATGIVRRIDELGRVVIPKEIRRTLRIREGDPLEIFTDREGEIILKKYSPIGELNDFSKEYALSIHQSTGHITAICDKDVMITVAGGGRRELIDKAVHEDIEQVMQSRTKIVRSLANGDELLSLTSDDDKDHAYTAQVVVPILAEGDAIGAIILLSRDQDALMGTMELKVAETAAYFIGKQMEQ
jgi:AbrB family transcriptional regulator (stage V sporulation protein T)